MSIMASAANAQKYRQLVGVVVKAGERLKTIQVRVAGQKWNDQIKKNFSVPTNILVNDPVRSTRVGDVIKFRSGWRVSKNIRHVVTEVVTPFGTPLSERPAVLTEEARTAERDQKRLEKDQRQAERGRGPAMKRLRLAEILVKKERIAYLAEMMARSRGLMAEQLQKELAENLPEEHWARRPGELKFPAANEPAKTRNLGLLIHLASLKVAVLKDEAFEQRGGFSHYSKDESAKIKAIHGHRKVSLELVTDQLLARDVDDADKKQVMELVDNAVAARFDVWKIGQARKRARAGSDVGSNTETPSTQVQEGGAPGPDHTTDKAVP